MFRAMTLCRKLQGFFMQLLVLTLVVVGPGLSDAEASGDTSAPAFASLFGGPFELIDQDGQPKSDRDFRGKFMLIYFGYVNCPALCPANLQQMAGALEELGAQGKIIQPIFISIDEARDTPARIKDFVAEFGPEFIGLTGTRDKIRSVAKAFKVMRRKVVLPDQTSKDDYLVHHATFTYLMDRDGKLLTFFPHNTDGREMARRIRNYL